MTLRTRVMLNFVLVVAWTLGSSGFIRIINFLRLQTSVARHIGTMIPFNVRRKGDVASVEGLYGGLMRDFPVFENQLFILSAQGTLGSSAQTKYLQNSCRLNSATTA